MNSFGLILVSHGGLSKGLLSSVEMIMGPRSNTVTISLEPDMGLSNIRELIEEKIKQLRDCLHVFIVSDLFGGTPSNASVFLAESCPDRITLITGMNLPMLVQFYSSSTENPGTLANELETVGKEGIQTIRTNILPDDSQSLN